MTTSTNEAVLTWTNDGDTNEFCEKCQHICTDGASCSCHPEYQLKDDLITCIDVDECVAQLHNCTENTTCVNREDSYDDFKTKKMMMMMVMMMMMNKMSPVNVHI